MCYLGDGDRVFETYWTKRRGAEAMDYSYALMDLTVYGRQESWEDSPRLAATVHHHAHRRRPARLATSASVARRTPPRPVVATGSWTLSRPRHRPRPPPG